MASLPFALSVHHFITTVGSDAGFASIIGLAILVLLYFAQARETATLRAQAVEAAQRVKQLEDRLMQLGRQPAAPVQAHRPPEVEPVLTRAPERVSAPAAPAGVAAPALAAATRVINVTPPAAPQPVTAAAQPAAAAPHRAAAATALRPATVAGAGNGTVRDPVQAPQIQSSQPAQAPPSLQIRSAAPAAAARPAVTPPRNAPPPRSGSRRTLVLVIGALAAAGVVAVLVVITSNSGSGNKSSASAGTRTSNAPQAQHSSHGGAFNPSSVTVAVLNGTAMSGLAHRVALRLGSDGYKEGTIATASDQTRSATVIAYLPSHKNDALKVAQALRLGPASVQPVDPSTQAVACPPPTACTATVVVTVGSDLSSI